MRIRWWPSRRFGRHNPGELERRLADLREAMYNASYARSDAARHRKFLETLFEQSRRSEGSFISVVEARDEEMVPAEYSSAGHTEAVAGGKASRPLAAGVAALVFVAASTYVYFFGGADPSIMAAGLSPDTSVKVGLLKVVDTVGLYQSVDKGYFKQENLDVDVHEVQSGPEAIKELTEKKLDVAFTSYPGAFVAQAQYKADLKIVAPAYVARPSHLMLMGASNRSFTQPKQATGKRIAVTGTGSISDIGTIAALREANVDPGSITWQPMAMRDMDAALERGEVDGAVMAEPYVTEAEDKGAVYVLDVTLGQASGLPLSGWFVNADYAKAQPKVVQAFQRGLDRGVRDIQTRDKRDPIVVKYLGVSPAIVDRVRIADYPVTLVAADIQKVADLINQLGFLLQRLDVSRMLLQPGEGDN